MFAPANTYTYEMMRQLDEAILDARIDERVHAILVRGQGDKFFCAGANIRMLEQVSPGYKYCFCLHANETLNRLEQTPKPVVAALNGHTVGGGMEIALACDLRFMARGKGRLGLVEVKIGAIPGMGGTQRLPRRIGKTRALRMMLTGETVDAEEALRLGLVDQVHEPEDLMPKTIEYARTLAQGATLAMGLIKQCVQEGLEVGLAAGLALERANLGVAFRSEDFKEGSRAFTEKRSPAFTGR